MWPLVILSTGLTFWVAGGQWGTGSWPGVDASPIERRSAKIVLAALVATTIGLFILACQQ